MHPSVPGTGSAAASPLVRAARARAAAAHRRQVRSGSGGRRYIEHPEAVARLLERHGYGEEVVAAALLHDVVEHSGTTLAELRGEFGGRVAELVGALSDDASIEDYRARKDEHRARVRRRGGDALAIYAADKLANASTLHRSLRREGAAVRAEFEVPLELKLQVWEADAEMLRAEAAGLPFRAELEATLGRLRAGLEAVVP